MTALASKSRFGYQMLLSMGWDENKGLGKEEQGMCEIIKVEVRKEGQALGADDKEKEAKANFVPWTVHKDSFNDLLKKLAKAAPAAPAPKQKEEEAAVEEEDEEENRRKRREERKRRRQEAAEAEAEAEAEQPHEPSHGGLAGASAEVSREEKRRRKEQRREERARALALAGGEEEY